MVTATGDSNIHGCVDWASLVAQMIKNPPAMQKT